MKNTEIELVTALPDFIQELLVKYGFPAKLASWIDQMISLVIILVLAWLIGYLADKLLNRLIVRLVKFTKAEWDDVFFNNKVFHKVMRLVPPILVYLLLPLAIRSDALVGFLQKIASIYIVFRLLSVIGGITKSLTVIYSKKSGYSTKPIQVFFQIINVFSYFLGGILVLSILIDQSITSLIAGLGASMAIIVLIFKDSILGFISGWQLTSNDLLRIGDWITVNKYGADGDVIDMNLYSVKVRNFDNTITTVPPYALMSESFQNWRGMQEIGGRRIKRSLNIDMNTVKICDDAMLEKFRKIEILKDYIDNTQQRLDVINRNFSKADMSLPNVVRQTNIGIFRAYVLEYLKRNPDINHNLTCMVRQMQPNEKGLPLEIYCFTSDIRWENYEKVQSDIFDHIISIVGEFGLKIYQYPSMWN